MEHSEAAIISGKKGIHIPKEIIEKMGFKLKSTCMNDVMLLITKQDDNRFIGELLSSDDLTFFFPETQ